MPSSLARSAGLPTFQRPALAKKYYYVEGDSDGEEEAAAPAARPWEPDAATRTAPSTRRLRRARPATIPMRRRIDPLGLARMPLGLPADQPSSAQLGNKKLAGLIARSMSSNSSAMMQAFHARQRGRVYGRGRKAWSSLYMDHRMPDHGHQQSAEIPPDELASQAHIRRMRMMIKLNNASKPREEKIQPFCPWKPYVWERMIYCDYCFRHVSPGGEYTPCLICNVVAHASCLRDVALSGGSGKDSRRAGGGAGRESGPWAELGAEFPGVFLDGDKRGACSGDGGSGEDDCETADPRPRTTWVCGHCTQEYRLQASEQAAAALSAAARKKTCKGHRYGYDEYEPEHQTMLDGVTLFQARWRGLRTRRQLEELKYNHFRAWSFDVLGLDGIPCGRDQPPGLHPGKPSSAPDPLACYQVVVTVIQDMSPVGIEKSAPPVQLFRHDTPVVPTVKSAGLRPSLGPLSPAIPGAVPGSSASGSSSLEFNSEMFVPGTRPWTTVVLTVVKTSRPIQSHGTSGAKPTKKPRQAQARQKRAAAAAAADAAADAAAAAAAAAAEGASAATPSAVFVGQGFLHLKSDLCRGTGRSLCLPLRPQHFRVEALQMTTPDHLLEGLTVRARLRPLSDVTSKCGYINVVFWSGRTNGPSERPSRFFGLLAGSMLFLYSKACSQKPPRVRLALHGASVWAKATPLQVHVSLRTPDDLGRTNFQINASSLEEVKAWRSRLLAASADDAPPNVHVPS